MTIRIYAHQKRGIKLDTVEEDFEFCCWESLSKWLKGFSTLPRCEDCLKKGLNTEDDSGKEINKGDKKCLEERKKKQLEKLRMRKLV